MEGHGDRRRGSGRCRSHRRTHQDFERHLQRLLHSRWRGARAVYDSLIDDVVASSDPLLLFGVGNWRDAVLFIEALHRVHRGQVERGDALAEPMIAPLGYARWRAWRLLVDRVRDGSVPYVPGIATAVDDSRSDVVRSLAAGWRPDGIDDAELDELINNL